MTTASNPELVVHTLASRTRPVTAARALWTFLRDKEDTTSVIRVFRAADGVKPERNFERFCATDAGRRVLAEGRSLGAALCDRDALRGLPEGSLGRAYLAFAEREGITIEALRAASDAAHAGRRQLEPARMRYRDRFRDMHDLWHVVTGYGRDALGETCLLAFTWAQTRQRGFALVTAAWTVKLQARGWRAGRCVMEAARLGKRAEWMLAQDWEQLLCEPLGEVRGRLKVDMPRQYQRQIERADGMLAG